MPTLREMRRARGETQADVANACRIGRKALRALESGRSVGNEAQLSAIADHFGVRIQDLPEEIRPFPRRRMPDDKALLFHVFVRIIAVGEGEALCGSRVKDDMKPVTIPKIARHVRMVETMADAEVKQLSAHCGMARQGAWV